jgi:hypothetical protein
MTKKMLTEDKNNNNKCLLIIPDVYFVYLPQICNMNTLAIKIKLITSTGTGPTLRPGESSV